MRAERARKIRAVSVSTADYRRAKKAYTRGTAMPHDVLEPGAVTGTAPAPSRRLLRRVVPMIGRRR